MFSVLVPAQQGSIIVNGQASLPGKLGSRVQAGCRDHDRVSLLHRNLDHSTGRVMSRITSRASGDDRDWPVKSCRRPNPVWDRRGYRCGMRYGLERIPVAACRPAVRVDGAYGLQANYEFGLRRRGLRGPGRRFRSAPRAMILGGEIRLEPAQDQCTSSLRWPR